MTGIEAPPTVYPSKRDSWLIAVVWIVCFALLVAAVRLWGRPEPLVYRMLVTVLILSVNTFVLWLFYSTRYLLDGGALTAFAGPFRWTVPLESIQAVRHTRLPLSAPACSLDRLQVRHGGHSLGLLISPVDREDFLRDLRLRCPHLVESGGGLVAR